MLSGSGLNLLFFRSFILLDKIDQFYSRTTPFFSFAIREKSVTVTSLSNKWFRDHFSFTTWFFPWLAWSIAFTDAAISQNGSGTKFYLKPTPLRPLVAANSAPRRSPAWETDRGRS